MIADQIKSETIQEQVGRDAEVGVEQRNARLEDYLPLVRTIAADMCLHTSANVEFDDLMSNGIFGLIDAIESYDPSRDVKFSTYCKPRIRGAMIDALRENDWVPRLTRQRSSKMRKAYATLESRLERTPSDEELAKELGVGKKEFKRIRLDCTPVCVVPLSHVASSPDDDDLIVDTIRNEKAEDPFKRLENKDSHKYLMNELSRVERLIIELYYYESLTMCEIGKVLGISESRVSQIHTDVLDRLRGFIRENSENFAGAH